MRYFFLKRIIIRSLLTKLNQNKRFRAISGKYTIKILKALLTPYNHIKKEDKTELSNYDVFNTLYNTNYINKNVFHVDMIYLDHAIFGSLTIMADGLIFINEKKDLSDPKYKYGPSADIEYKTKHKEKAWLFENVTEIIARKYNLIKQAVEIFLKNGKSVFLVIYPYNTLDKFLNLLKQYTKENRKFKIINNPKEAFSEGKFTESWKQGKMTNFEYLMKLNHYSSRSPQDLSQYPVFPWVLADYDSAKLLINNPSSYRNFKLSVAAFSDKKVKVGEIKYANSYDFPDGNFQFGTHYMPGRIVLSYLMRIQPYTMMLSQFDSGDEATARKLHSLKNSWKCSCDEDGVNYELIPEYFYNPEIFTNM